MKEEPDVDRRAEPTIPTVAPIRALGSASDAELAQALCVRDLGALEEAFQRHATLVANAARRVAGWHYVDDVVQEVFLSLWRSPQRFDPERGSLAKYLVMVTHAKTIDAVRTDDAWHRRHRERGLRSRPHDLLFEDEVVADMSAEALRGALRALPLAERVAIELAFFGGYSYREVAAELGEPEGTIKSRIRAGLRRLEAALREAGVELE